MALYISSGQRRRRIIWAAAVGVTAGLIFGLVIGRWSAPSPVDQARESKQLAGRVTGQLGAFPLHYEEQSRGAIDREAFRSSLDAGLKRADEDLATAITL